MNRYLSACCLILAIGMTGCASKEYATPTESYAAEITQIVETQIAENNKTIRSLSKDWSNVANALAEKIGRDNWIELKPIVTGASSNKNEE